MIYEIYYLEDCTKTAQRRNQRTGEIEYYQHTSVAGTVIATHLDREITEKHIAKINRCHKGAKVAIREVPDAV